ncbi:MAG: hypothetical protein ACRBCJ_06240 [Hyphomicrobiaceae bacterium]
MARSARVHTRTKQTTTARLAVSDLARGLILGMSGTAVLMAAIVFLYLAKSAAGINLMPGPSPLHDYLYHFVQ